MNGHYKTIATLLGLSLLSACGKAEFQTGFVTQAQSAPGAYEVPAKVDILLVQDDTGSTVPILNELNTATRAFLSDLNGRGWDYHFATIPMTLAIQDQSKRIVLPPRTTTEHPVIEQVVASRYDGNYAFSPFSGWLEPYPGADPTDPMIRVNPSYFETPSSYSGFVSDVQVAANSNEPTFESIRWILSHPSSLQSGFIRPDAITAVVVVGNGDDNSHVNSCKRSDGQWVVCSAGMLNYATNPPSVDNSYTTSMNEYKAAFTQLKGSKGMFRMLTAVANSKTSNCAGSASLRGNRYMQMATFFGAAQGSNADICSRSPISSVLSQLSGSLSSQRLDMITRYLPVGFKPNMGAPFTVTKHSGGNDIVLKMNDPNGFRYIGEVKESDPAIYQIEAISPTGEIIKMNRITGYLVELLGNGVLHGDETADINAQPSR